MEEPTTETTVEVPSAEKQTKSSNGDANGTTSSNSMKPAQRINSFFNTPDDASRLSPIRKSEARRKKREDLEQQMKIEEERWEQERQRRQEERKKRKEQVQSYSKTLHFS